VKDRNKFQKNLINLRRRESKSWKKRKNFKVILGNNWKMKRKSKERFSRRENKSY